MIDDFKTYAENTDPYELLASAIILQACDDFKEAYRKENYPQLFAIRHFFESEYFATLTSINPDYLIRNLLKEVMEEEQ